MITLALDAATARFLAADGEPLSPTLALGATPLCERWLRHESPSALEVEAAIEAVEDLVMPLHGRWPADPELHVRLEDAAAPALAALLGPRFDLAQLERVFDRAAAVAGGRPATLDPALADRRVMALLVVLREAMHHLGFTQASLA